MHLSLNRQRQMNHGAVYITFQSVLNFTEYFHCLTRERVMIQNYTQIQKSIKDYCSFMPSSYSIQLESQTSPVNTVIGVTDSNSIPDKKVNQLYKAQMSKYSPWP